jgi:hypothetical protein
MKDLNKTLKIILSCPLCGKRCAHNHRVAISPYHGGEYHRLTCESCGRKTAFTKAVFEALSDNFEIA